MGTDERILRLENAMTTLAEFSTDQQRRIIKDVNEVSEYLNPNFIYLFFRHLVPSFLIVLTPSHPKASQR